MADVAVENNETPTIEKASTEVDKEVVDEASVEKNCASKKENGAEVKVDTDSSASDVAAETEKAEASDENGDEVKVSKEENDSADSAPAEAVKRKVVEADTKPEESTATPEKKAKLDEPLKEDTQNGSEASEAAA